MVSKAEFPPTKAKSSSLSFANLLSSPAIDLSVELEPAGLVEDWGSVTLVVSGQCTFSGVRESGAWTSTRVSTAPSRGRKTSSTIMLSACLEMKNILLL